MSMLSKTQQKVSPAQGDILKQAVAEWRLRFPVDGGTRAGFEDLMPGLLDDLFPVTCEQVWRRVMWAFNGGRATVEVQRLAVWDLAAAAVTLEHFARQVPFYSTVAGGAYYDSILECLGHVGDEKLRTRAAAGLYAFGILLATDFDLPAIDRGGERLLRSKRDLLWRTVDACARLVEQSERR